MIEQDDELHVTYRVARPGRFLVRVYLNDAEIDESPFHVEAVAPRPGVPLTVDNPVNSMPWFTLLLLLL